MHMVQLDIDPGLYDRMLAHADQSSQSVVDWLQAVVDRQSDLSAYQIWFSHLISHELRTPLAAILSSTDLLKHYRDRLTEERRTEHLDTIQMQVRALNHLLDNVVIIQQHENNQLVFHPEPQDLVRLCQGAAQASLQIVYEPPQILFDGPDNLPPIRFDEKLLRIALVNLLVNAIRFSADRLPVHLTVGTRSDQAIIEIRDSGIGIPPDEQAQVFDLFYRASNAQFQSGHGLGLAVVQRVIDLHGGAIHMDSVPGQGTTVTLSLPVN